MHTWYWPFTVQCLKMDYKWAWKKKKYCKKWKIKMMLRSWAQVTVVINLPACWVSNWMNLDLSDTYPKKIIRLKLIMSKPWNVGLIAVAGDRRKIPVANFVDWSSQTSSAFEDFWYMWGLKMQDPLAFWSSLVII